MNRLGTLTYAGAGSHDPATVRSDVGVFFRRLREALRGEPFPYVWVPEWHKTDHGLHLHFGVGRYIRRADIERAWGHGFVHIKQLAGVPSGSGRWGQARRAAGYLSKYVAKSFEDDQGRRRPGGLHRYDRAEGFNPAVVRLRGVSAFDVTRQAMNIVGGEPVRWWSSDQVDGWQAPPSIWMQWG